MFEKLDTFYRRREELERLISDPSVISDNAKYQEYTREYSVVSQIAKDYSAYKDIVQQIKEHESMLGQHSQEPEFAELVSHELQELNAEKNKLEEEIKLLLIPSDPMDSRNTIVEIRAGTGGEEAALFAAVLFRMYARYAEKQGWKLEALSTSETGIGGFKEIIFSIEGNNVYKKIRYESGVHRVQRIPVTETGGRIHTSTATVMVLPEIEEVEIDINQKDLRIDTYRASGHGGQHVNVTDSAVRITHIPTGVVVQCQDERSQLKNKTKAMRILRARVKEKFEEEEQKKRSAERRSQVKTGDRSEKIRTYNYPQNRISEHRIGLNLHNLQEIIDGDLDPVINALITKDYEGKLAEYGAANS